MAHFPRDTLESELARCMNTFSHSLARDPNAPDLLNVDVTERQELVTARSISETARNIELNQLDIATQKLTVSSSTCQRTEVVVAPGTSSAMQHVYQASTSIQESTFVSVGSMSATEFEEFQRYIDVDWVLDRTLALDVTKGSMWANTPAQGSVNSGSHLWHNSQNQAYNFLLPIPHQPVAPPPPVFGAGNAVHHLPHQDFPQCQYMNVPFQPQYNMGAGAPPPQVNPMGPPQQAMPPPPRFPPPFPGMLQPYGAVVIKKEKPDQLPSCRKGACNRFRCYQPGCRKMYAKKAFYKNHLRSHTDWNQLYKYAGKMKPPTVLELIQKKEAMGTRLEKPIQCPTCQQIFTCSDLATTHQAMHAFDFLAHYARVLKYQNAPKF